MDRISHVAGVVGGALVSSRDAVPSRSESSSGNPNHLLAGATTATGRQIVCRGLRDIGSDDREVAAFQFQHSRAGAATRAEVVRRRGIKSSCEHSVVNSP